MTEFALCNRSPYTLAQCISCRLNPRVTSPDPIGQDWMSPELDEHGQCLDEDPKLDLDELPW